MAMDFSLLWGVPLALLGLYLTLYVVYQTVLFAASAAISDPPTLEPSRFRRFNIIVPAHNEEPSLPRLLASATADDYPRDRFRVTVIADNCTDGTVAACGGHDVDVLERHDLERRGKGNAIRWALGQLALDKFDALVVVDGDSVIAPGFLRHLNLQMELGDRVIQCYNGVANPGQSWFTRLMDVSRTIANEIIHPAKRKLGLSSHLMGNGMCFDVHVLQSTGWNALSAGEDWEYYAQLVMGGGVVGYSKGSRVFHQESASLRQASTQRMRWSSGRFAVLKRFGPAMLVQGLRTRNLTCLDAALPLVLPNPSLGINLTLMGLLAGWFAWFSAGTKAFAIWFGLLAAAQFAMLIVGVLHTRQRAASAASLVLAPLFLIWKMGIDLLSLFGIGSHEWKHTHRRAS
jgi:cellulose synthase/poly-beta-1,6-N-acetylglucosamine synthase-like glycosyltransferase